MFYAYILLLFILFFFSIPLLGIISLVLYITNGSPIFFRQVRVGKNGKLFEIYKFRTMGIDSQQQKKKLLKRNEANGPVFKIKNDPRFTPVGKFLAHTGLDELPQLWNVIKGDMALIGPRPLPVDEEKQLKPWQKKRQEIKPGIISPWILQGYHSMSFDAWMKSDIVYVRQKSTAYDIHLTVGVVQLLFRLFLREIQSLRPARV